MHTIRSVSSCNKNRIGKMHSHYDKYLPSMPMSLLNNTHTYVHLLLKKNINKYLLLKRHSLVLLPRCLPAT